MRKFLCLLAIIVLCVPSFCYADTPQWVRVTTDNVPLYANSDCAKVICNLEKSYYLTVMGRYNDVYLVTIMDNSTGFPSISGYVNVAEVEQCSEQPVYPLYPTQTINVMADSATLRLNASITSPTVITATNTQRLSYYGQLNGDGRTWYYVCYCNKFGYVDSDSVSNPLVALHPTPLYVEEPTPVINPIEDEPTDEPKEEQPEPTPTPVTEIALIGFVVLLAVGLVLALFLPSKKSTAEYYDSEL